MTRLQENINKLKLEEGVGEEEDQVRFSLHHVISLSMHH